MIFYFSATGNSLYVAKKIQEDSRTHPSRSDQEEGEKLIEITDAMHNKQYHYQLTENEKIGFVFPVYFYGIPTIVNDFIDHLVLAGMPPQRYPECPRSDQERGNLRAYFYLVLTCGGTIANADKMFRQVLSKRGYFLSSSFSVVMPNNYVLKYELPSISEQKILLANSKIKTEAIIASINKNELGDHSSDHSILPGLITTVAYPFYKNGRKTHPFHVSAGCTGCGLCERNCPSGTIKRPFKNPIWVTDQCIHCLACINRCPEKAIQYGNGTKNRRRYINPILERPAKLPTSSELEACITESVPAETDLAT